MQRAPCLRLVAVGLGLLSGWLLLGEACATALLLPTPLDALPALCPPRLATHLVAAYGGGLGAAPLLTLLLVPIDHLEGLVAFEQRRQLESPNPMLLGARLC